MLQHSLWERCAGVWYPYPCAVFLPDSTECGSFLRPVFPKRPPWNPWSQPAFPQNRIELFLKNLHSPLVFIRNEITDEELLWLSEIFEDIATKTHSMEFIQCVRERATKVENQEWRKDIQQEIEEWAVPAANGQTIVLGS